MKYFLMMLSVGLSLTASVAAAEQAWLRFDPERSGSAKDTDFTNGWHAVEQFEFAAPPAGSSTAIIGFTGAVGPATPQLLQDVMDERVFDSVEIVFREGDRQTRLLLERVLVAELNIHWEVGEQSPRQETRLTYAAMTYIYEPLPDEEAGIYAEIDIATGAGSDGDYQPRDPDVKPVFGARLMRSEVHPSQFTLSWQSEPGIQYLIEYTDDLMSDDWLVVPGPQLFGDEGRETAVTVTEPRGFYRIRER